MCQLPDAQCEREHVKSHRLVPVSPNLGGGFLPGGHQDDLEFEGDAAMGGFQLPRPEGSGVITTTRMKQSPIPRCGCRAIRKRNDKFAAHGQVDLR
jgi:hypothetical protein